MSIITVKQVVVEKDKSIRIKTTEGKNLNCRKSLAGWEQLKEEGASFEVTTKPSSFENEDGETIHMMWIEGLTRAAASPAKGGGQSSTQDSIEKQTVFKAVVELACARIAAGTEQTEGNVIAAFKMLLDEFRHIDDVPEDSGIEF